VTRSNREGLERILRLLNLPDKRSVEKYCRDLVIRSEDFADILLAARMVELSPYRYANHFSEITPNDLYPTEGDLAAVAANGVGLMSPKAKKAATKINQIFIDRRLFAAHLFFTPSYKFSALCSKRTHR
jgi:hypothetical protein